MWIRVIDVLDLLASGLTQQQVLEKLPDLEAADISASLQFASSPSIPRFSQREDLD